MEYHHRHMEVGATGGGGLQNPSQAPAHWGYSGGWAPPPAPVPAPRSKRSHSESEDDAFSEESSKDAQ